MILAPLLFLAANFPQAELSNPQLHVKIALPDARQGFYRGTRFDWSGMVVSLVYRGHEYYGPWFDGVDPAVHDFAYRGASVIACPSTAATGPAEEFITADNLPLGYDQAAPGGTFIKVGVGALRKPDDGKYDRFHLYEIVDGATWSTHRTAHSIEFTQRVSADGFGYVYEKTVTLDAQQPVLRIAHTLRNTGTKPIETNVYNHNFLRIDGEAPGPDYQLTFPFALKPSSTLDPSLAAIEDDHVVYRKSLTGEERVATPIAARDGKSADYKIRIANRKSRTGLEITGDRPLQMESLWSIRTVLAVEPFVNISVAPGAAFSWSATYRYFSE